MANYKSLHFQSPDPILKQAVSRTTRYRLLKKRKMMNENSYDSESMECTYSEESTNNRAEELQWDAFEGNEAFVGDLSEQPETHDLILASTDSATNQGTEDEYPVMDFGRHDVNNYLEVPGYSEEDEEELQPDLEETDIRTSDSVQDPLEDLISPSSILVKQYSIQHNLTQQALVDLLQLLHLQSHSSADTLPCSLYKFNKQFNKLKYPINKHYFCSHCLQLLPSNQLSICPNGICKISLKSKGAISSFLEISLEAQLINLLQRKACWNEITSRYTLRKRIGENRSDIQDGNVYQNLLQTGFLQQKLNISLIMNVDGVPVFRSSSYSFWPIFVLVNELPFRIRIAKQNRLLAGLWYGNCKPDMTLFLKPLAKTLIKLHNEGFKITSPMDKKEYTCHAVLIACTCDLPARAMVMNIVQFNGNHGCSHCKQKGANVTTENGGNVHTYPYCEKDPTGPKRNLEEHHQNAIDAVESNSTVFGVKGPSYLEIIPNFDFVSGMSFDYMHCVLLGIVRLLLKLWFTTSFHKYPWYLGKVVKQIDSIYCKIRPPDEISRTPRSIEITLKYWKAHELRAWLLHYSPIVLNGILAEDYYQHHLLLVEGIYLLLKDIVTKDDIIQSKRLLNHYCFLFPALYDKRYVTLNVHGLLHLPEVVENLGPLWAHSCFPFENANGDLLKYFHGSSGVEKQVIEHITTIQILPSMRHFFYQGSKEEDLYMHMSTEIHKYRKNCDVIEPGYCAHGKHMQAATLLEEELKLFIEGSITLPASYSISQYKSLHLINKNRIIKTQLSSKAVLRDNSGVVYLTSGATAKFGRLQKLLVFENNALRKAYAVVLCLDGTTEKLCNDSVTDANLNDHIVLLKIPREMKRCVVPITFIKDKCLLLSHSAKCGMIYASLFPNSAEPE